MVWGNAAAAAAPAAGNAWADDEPDAEEAQRANAQPASNPDFPTLGEAIKQAHKAKKKGKTMPLGEFVGGAHRTLANTAERDKALLASLPTAPRGEGAAGGEDDGGMGGAFNRYGR